MVNHFAPEEESLVTMQQTLLLGPGGWVLSFFEEGSFVQNSMISFSFWAVIFSIFLINSSVIFCTSSWHL